MNGNPDSAIAELLENLRLMMLAGEFQSAASCAIVLAESPAWRPFAHGKVSSQLPHVLEHVFALADVALPATAASPALSREQLQVRLQATEEAQWRTLLMSWRVQQQTPAGQFWSATALAAPLFKSGTPREHGLRWWDAEFVLKARLQARCATDKRIEASPEALALPAAAIADFLLRLQRLQPVGYSEYQILSLALVDCLLHGELESASALAQVLLDSEQGRELLFWALTLEPVRGWIGGGVLAEPLRICIEAIADYQKALLQRPVRPHRPTIPRKLHRPKVNETTRVSTLLADSPFAGLQWRSLSIGRDPRSILSAACDGMDPRELWRTLRRLTPVTGRVPVLTLDWTGAALDDLFGEDGFDRENGSDDCSVEGILKRAAEASASELLAARETEHHKLEYSTWEQMAAHELDDTRHRCGAAPTPEDVLGECPRCGDRPHRLELDRWLLGWELTRGSKSVADLAVKQAGFVSSGMHVLLLPTVDSWDALAWMHWYGAEATQSAPLISLGRSWQRRFGAEIYAHFGTMFECLVERAPTDLESAWQLAREQHLIAPYSLYAGGISTRALACGLIGHDHWFFHERP